MKYMLKRKNSNNTEDPNTQPNFSALYGKNEHVTDTISIGVSVSIS